MDAILQQLELHVRNLKVAKEDNDRASFRANFRDLENWIGEASFNLDIVDCIEEDE